MAVDAGHEEIVRTLLGAEGVFGTGARFGDGEVAVASEKCNQLLGALRQGRYLDVNAQDATGKTALMMAASRSSTELVRFALEATC